MTYELIRTVLSPIGLPRHVYVLIADLYLNVQDIILFWIFPSVSLTLSVSFQVKPFYPPTILKNVDITLVHTTPF